MEALYLLLLIAFAVLVLRKPTRREGFSLAFNKCRAKGYSKEFCVQTPTTHFGPGACRCLNGALGRRYPGFGGKCVCTPFIF
jgi:hypothetical protein